ncbi:MAG TPA: HAMP domain-containing methyl-accepting chemotaxis protein [Ureibacillus sp.]|nr:HAMP domain-containing methyl-accepting chemotaxis protein [Ureibacillus sp.]
MKLFKPIVKLLNNLKFVQKFSIIGVILLLPFAIDSIILLSNSNSKVEKAEKQYSGIEYNQLLQEVLQNVQQTRALTVSATQGDNSVKEDLVSKQETISSLMKELEDYDKNAKFDFEMSDTISSIKTDWEKLSSTNWTDSSDVVSEFSLLTEKIISAMSTVSNNSELVMANSKELDSLVTTISTTIPNLTEYLGKARATGVSIINSGTVTDTDLATFNNLVIPTDISLNQLASELNVSFGDSAIQSSLQSDYDTFTHNVEDFMQLTDSTILANNLSVDSKTYYDNATVAIDSAFTMYDNELTLLTSVLDESLNESKSLRTLLFTCVVVVLILAIYIFAALSLSLRNSIKQLQEVATEVANGNLDTSVSLNTKDEMNNIEKSFNIMINNLRDLVQQISQSSQHVAASSEELNASAEETTAAIEHVSYSIESMASGAKTQTNGINDSTQSLHEMATGIQRIAENSSRVTELTRETSQLAEDGNKTVSKTFDQMNTVQASVMETNLKINELNERSQEIGSILAIITGIADQTNLLALNAAIEAARAGEHGKGFAVVADEVRNLAEQSRESATQIAQLINMIQQDTVTSVAMMDQVNADVNIGLQMTEETAQKFSLILNSMNTLTPEMEEVSATSEQISAGTQEIVATMNEIMSVSTNNLHLSDEVASSTEEQLASMQEITSSSTALSKMAEDLQEHVQKFKL